MSTNGHERGRHGGLKCIKARARTEKTLYTLPGRYLAPFFSRTRSKFVTVLRSSRAQYVFLISQPRVSGPKTEHESFYLVYAAGESARNKKKLPLLRADAYLRYSSRCARKVTSRRRTSYIASHWALLQRSLLKKCFNDRKSRAPLHGCRTHLIDYVDVLLTDGELSCAVILDVTDNSANFDLPPHVTLDNAEKRARENIAY